MEETDLRQSLLIFISARSTDMMKVTGGDETSIYFDCESNANSVLHWHDFMLLSFHNFSFFISLVPCNIEIYLSILFRCCENSYRKVGDIGKLNIYLYRCYFLHFEKNSATK